MPSCLDTYGRKAVSKPDPATDASVAGGLRLGTRHVAPGREWRKVSRRRPVLFLSVLVLAVLTQTPDGLCKDGRSSDSGTLTKIISIAGNESSEGTLFLVQTNGPIRDVASKTLVPDGKIIIDIFCPAHPFKSRQIPLKRPLLDQLRIGYHPDRIRLVFDLNGKEIPRFKIRHGLEELVVFFGFGTAGSDEKPLRSRPVEEIPGFPEASTADESKVVAPEKSRTDMPASPNEPTVLSSGVALIPTVVSAEASPAGHALDSKSRINTRQTAADADAVFPSRRLTRLPAIDGSDDVRWYIEALSAYREEDWANAVALFDRFIEACPESRYADRAYHLLAKAYDASCGSSGVSNFSKIVRYYENAISRFPSSIFMPVALLGIGDLCFNNNSYSEALGYYNLILKNHSATLPAMHAMVQKARILLMKNRREDALGILKILEAHVFEWQSLPEMRAVNVEMAKVLHDINSFRKSLSILSELASSDPENIHTYPEISQYLGYNHYQLGHSAVARSHLMRFYNICPEAESNHLVLAQIGDTYREEGAKKKAVKFYQLVADRYPDSEGALISLIRLAEQQEEGTVTVSRRLVKPFKIIGRPIGLPREIYKEVAHKLGDKDVGNPLLQLAMVKLAVLYQKDKDYEKSLEAVRELLRKNPWHAIGQEIKDALLNLIVAILEEEMRGGRFQAIVDIYQNEQALFSTLNSPRIQLIAARALLKMNLEVMALELFKKADRRFQEKEKPSDLLFIMAKNLFDNQKFDRALRRLNLLIENHPESAYFRDAMRLKADIFSKQRQYALAAKTYSEILKSPMTWCQKVEILLEQANALKQSDRPEGIMAALEEIRNFADFCISIPNDDLRKIGDLYLDIEHPQEALDFYIRAQKQVKDPGDGVSLNFKMAQCYLKMNRKDDAVALYDRIAGLNEPFWSDMANEKLKELQFNQEIWKTVKQVREETLSVHAEKEDSDS